MRRGDAGRVERIPFDDLGALLLHRRDGAVEQRPRGFLVLTGS